MDRDLKSENENKQIYFVLHYILLPKKNIFSFHE